MIYHKITPLTDEDQATIERLSTELGLPPLVTGILVRRHLTEKQQIEEFLEGKPQPYYDPFLLKDMDKAVARICQALQQGEPMTIYGDYDVDGTSASSLLYLFLKAQGASVDVYVPRRDTEGYGLNGPALEKLARKGTRLLITVDTGISGAPVVDQAPKDLDIIITDHHLA
ncbi:DHH family phosphoesterase, partial [Acidaminococcus timonensis]